MHVDSEDAFITAEQQQKKLEQRLEEIQDALQKSEAAETPKGKKLPKKVKRKGKK